MSIRTSPLKALFFTLSLIALIPFTLGQGCDELSLISPYVTEYCEGDEITLEAESINGGSITWNHGENGIPFALEGFIGLVMFEATSDNPMDCPYPLMVEVMVNPKPFIGGYMGPFSACLGEEITLTGAGSADYYTWSGGVVDGEPFTTETIGTTDYTVTGETIAGCVNTGTWSVTVHPLPEIEASTSADTICMGEEITLYATGGLDFEWEPDTIETGTAYSMYTAGDFVFHVSGTDGFGCMNEDSVQLTVRELPGFETSISSEAICIGEEIIPNVLGDLDFEWEPDTIEAGTAYSIPTAGDFVFHVTGTDDYGCTNEDSVQFTVYDLPEVSVHTTATKLCSGDTVTLSGEGASTYIWSPGMVIDGVGFVLDTAGEHMFFLEGTDENGCTAQAEITLTVYELEIEAVATDEIFGNDGAIDIVVSGGIPEYLFDWDIDELEDFDDSQDLSDLTGGTYTVVVRDSLGCTATMEIIVDSQLQMVESNTETAKIYPNPTQQFVVVRLKGQFQYKLFSVSGEEFISGNGENETILPLTGFPTGTYFLHLESAGGFERIQLIIN